jgi:hypothetical protein
MRTTLAPTLTQQWLTIGLNKWHQSIAKREATRVSIQSKGLVIQWTAIDADAVSTWTTQFASPTSQSLPSQSNSSDELASLNGPQVVLIDRSKVERELTTWRSIDPAMFSVLCQRSSLPPVFLLWDWGPSGRSSLEWATSLGFAGVIFDFSTLRSWTRVAVDRLPTKLKELHPLVATLPNFKSAQSQN